MFCLFRPRFMIKFSQDLIVHLKPVNLYFSRSVVKQYTLICLSIRTHKTTNFPFVPNGKYMVLRFPNIEVH